MDKEQSLCIKGIAIILLLFLHLFCYTQNVVLCHNFCYIDGIPLVQFLTPAATAVNYFLIIGGYGLYILYKKNDNRRIVRIFKVYLHYWTVMAIFLVIGHYINKESYPGTLTKFISNFTSYETTYNTEMWFLLPYSILSLLSCWWFKIVKFCKGWIIVMITLMLHLVTSYGISRFADSFFYSHYYIYNLWLSLNMLFSFTLGAVACKYNLFSRITEKIHSILRRNRFMSANVVFVLIILVLVLLNCIFRIKIKGLYCFLMTACFCGLNFPTPIKNFLIALGKQSMNMWLIHSWLCYYLFHDFIYSFEYPLIISAVLIALSYYIGTVVDKIISPIEKKLLNKSQQKERVAI